MFNVVENLGQVFLKVFVIYGYNESIGDFEEQIVRKNGVRDNSLQ